MGRQIQLFGSAIFGLAMAGLLFVSQAGAAAPVNTVAPSISGTPEVGRTLTANPGTWTNSPTGYAYQWQGCTEAWTGYSNPSGANASWYDVAYGGSAGSEQFVAVGVGATSAGRIITSPDGVTWTARTDPGTDSLKEWRSVAYGAGRFVAVADYGDSGNDRVMTSTDGVNWSYATSVPTNAAWKGLAFGGGKFVAVASTGTVMTSTDGLTWSLASSSPLAGGANSINYGNGRFVVVGNDTAYYSANGDTFTQTTTPDNKNWNDVVYGGGKWVAVGTTSYTDPSAIALVSTDNGSTWTQTTIPNKPWFGVTYSDGQFTAAGWGGSSGIATSSNGTDWTIQSTPNLASYSITAGAGTLVTVGDGGGGAKPIANLVTTCSDISGANSSTYQLQAGDQGKKIKVKVTATNGSGSADATSSATGTVGPEPSPSAPSNTSPPTISGTAEVGSTLSVTSPGTWDGYPEPTYTYQWQRCEGGDDPVTYPLGAPYPTDIITDPSGNVYVTQRNPGAPGKVLKLTLPAGTVSEVGTTGELPRALTRDSAGNIYTANQTGHNVTKIAPDGTTSTFSLPGVNPEAADIKLDSSGNIYVAIKNLDTVAKLNPDGTAAGGNWPVSVTGGPRGLALDSAGKVYVTTQTVASVKKLNPDGTAAGSPWPVATGTGPFGIAIDSSDNVFVANVNSLSVTKIAADGTATTPFASLGAIPFGLTLDSSGNVYTANPLANTVSKITPDGTTSVLGSTGAGSSPNGVAVAPGGNVYTNNEGGASVTEFGPPLSCTDISGADDPTYSPTADDVGKKIRVKVTASNSAGSTSANSGPTANIAGPPANTSPPTISGEAKVGEKLTASPGTWSGNPAPTFTYQWQRCDAAGANCVDISGATGNEYTLTAADEGSRIRVVVTATNSQGTVPVNSEPTASIPVPDPGPNPGPDPGPNPNPSGKPKLKLSVKAPKKVKAGKGFRIKARTSNVAKTTTARTTSTRSGTTATKVKTCVKLGKGLFVVKSGRGKVKGRKICWKRSSLAAGKSVTYKATVRSSKTMSGSMKVTATATASGSSAAKVKASGSGKVRIVEPKAPPEPKPPTG